MSAPLLRQPDWPAPPGVHAAFSTRVGGVSGAPFASLNLGLHVGDDPGAVAHNRASVRAALPSEPVWMNQVHGIGVVDPVQVAVTPTADAAFTRESNVVCTVMTADCLPLFLASKDGAVVALAHAGWRGLAAGVIEATISAMRAGSVELLAFLGPAIGPQAYEVGDDVRQAFVAGDPAAGAAFVTQRAGRYLCDLYALARLRLRRAGVRDIFGGTACTVRNAGEYFSHRRDGRTGRMASFIWIDR